MAIAKMVLGKLPGVDRPALTGVFPRSPDEPVAAGPLELVKCASPDGCGLLQLGHSYSAESMYGQPVIGRRMSNNATIVGIVNPAIITAPR